MICPNLKGILIRVERYKEFKEGKFKIIVSTDLLGRGVNFTNVDLIINYDFPASADIYLQRVKMN